MAIPCGRGAIHRSAELCKTERSAVPQSSSRRAPGRRPAQATGAPAGHAAGPSGDVGQHLNGAGEAQAALDVEAAFGSFLDELVAATVRRSDAQRQIGRGRVGAWRRSLSALAERFWRLESKVARSQQ